MACGSLCFFMISGGIFIGLPIKSRNLSSSSCCNDIGKEINLLFLKLIVFRFRNFPISIDGHHRYHKEDLFLLGDTSVVNCT